MGTAESIERFVREDGDGGRFARQSARMLRIDVDERGAWLRPGAAVAYQGSVGFERLPTIQARSIVDAALREVSPLVHASGRGRLYCAHRGRHVHVVRIGGESLNVVWQDLLAFEASLTFTMAFVAHGVGLAAGGLTTVNLSGEGIAAILAHGEPMALRVTPDAPVTTDPHATVAWSGNLTPALKTDLSWRSAIAHGGREPIQMLFKGSGVVVVQPCEDPSGFSINVKRLSPLKRLFAS
jgi:uncharacterized protein (AIM24 family)